MYIPASFAASDQVVRDLLTNHGAADLITATSDGLLATFLPFLYDPAVGEFLRQPAVEHAVRLDDVIVRRDDLILARHDARLPDFRLPARPSLRRLGPT